MKKILAASAFLVAAGSAFAFSEWHVRGGTPEFVRFLQEAAGDSVHVKTYSDMAYMPFKTATNAVFFVLPDYSKGKETLPDLGAVNCAKAQEAIDRGCRVYVENSLSVSPEARKLLSVELLGAKRVPFTLEYVEWNGDVLQARQSSYLPALPRFTSQRSPARSFVDVSDCLGVHGVRKPGRHRLPLLVESQKGRMFTALTSFSRYDVKFMRPYVGWKAFYADFLFRIAKADKVRAERAFASVYSDFMRTSGGDDPEALVKKAVEWHLKSGILRAPGGTNGMYEAVLSDTLGFRKGLRRAGSTAGMTGRESASTSPTSRSPAACRRRTALCGGLTRRRRDMPGIRSIPPTWGGRRSPSSTSTRRQARGATLTHPAGPATRSSSGWPGAD